MTRAMADKNLLMLGAMGMVAGGVIMGLAETSMALYTGRAMGGIGGAIFSVILTNMLTDWFFEKEIATALGIMLTAWPIGIVLGPTHPGLVGRDVWLELGNAYHRQPGAAMARAYIAVLSGGAGQGRR